MFNDYTSVTVIREFKDTKIGILGKIGTVFNKVKYLFNKVKCYS